MDNDLDRPRDDEIEVSLFGPGYGEALVIHLGYRHWILIDSCLEPRSGAPAALEYLTKLSVDVAAEVKLIVATHWHDDHIRGLAAVLRACPSARLALSAALSKDEFLRLLGLRGRDEIGVRRSGLSEVVAMSRILEERRRPKTHMPPFTFAISHRLLYHAIFDEPGRRMEAAIYALSPSDASVARAQLAFAELLPRVESERLALLSPRPNHASVVLGGRVGTRVFLLGADLERRSDVASGWLAIIDHPLVPLGRAEVFKVAHHGAESGHEPRVWDELLVPEPYALLTPWSKGARHLPTSADVDRMIALTDHAYITAAPSQRRQRWSDPVVRDMVRSATKSMYDAQPGWGHLRLRGSLSGVPRRWEIHTFGDARALRDFPRSR